MASLLKNYEKPGFDRNFPEAFCILSHNGGATLNRVEWMEVPHFNCIRAYLHVYSIIPFV